MPRLLFLAMVLLFFAALPTVAQSPGSSSPSPASPPQDANPPAESKKPKKVWTNENIADVNSDAKGGVSVVGDSKPDIKTKSTSPKPAEAQYIATVRRQLQKLQQQMSEMEKQINDLTKFSKGEAAPTSGMQLHKSYKLEPVDAQIRALEEKRKHLQAQMDALLDDARKKGVEPGQLR